MRGRWRGRKGEREVEREGGKVRGRWRGRKGERERERVEESERKRGNILEGVEGCVYNYG